MSVPWSLRRGFQTGNQPERYWWDRTLENRSRVSLWVCQHQQEANSTLLHNLAGAGHWALYSGCPRLLINGLNAGSRFNYSYHTAFSVATQNFDRYVLEHVSEKPCDIYLLCACIVRQWALHLVLEPSWGPFPAVFSWGRPPGGNGQHYCTPDWQQETEQIQVTLCFKPNSEVPCY